MVRYSLCLEECPICGIEERRTNEASTVLVHRYVTYRYSTFYCAFYEPLSCNITGTGIRWLSACLFHSPDRRKDDSRPTDNMVWHTDVVSVGYLQLVVQQVARSRRDAECISRVHMVDYVEM